MSWRRVPRGPTHLLRSDAWEDALPSLALRAPGPKESQATAPLLLTDSPRPAGRSDPGSYQMAVFPWLVCRRLYVCPLKMTFLFPQSCGSPAVKPRWPSKPNAVGGGKGGMI